MVTCLVAARSLAVEKTFILLYTIYSMLPRHNPPKRLNTYESELLMLYEIGIAMQSTLRLDQIL